jgi:hypothetical protein
MEKNERLVAVAFQRAESSAVARALANLGFGDMREVESPPSGIALSPGFSTHQHAIISSEKADIHLLEPAFAGTLAMAERYGLSSRRSAVLRAALAGASTADPVRKDRLARLLRQWITARKLKTLDDRLRRLSR